MTVMAHAAIRKRAVERYLVLGDARVVGKEFAYSHQTILNWVREARMPVKSRGWPSLTYNQDVAIFRYYLKGAGVLKTAWKFDVTKGTVRRAVRRIMATVKERIGE